MENFNLFNNAPDRSITNTIELMTPEKADYVLKTSNTHNRPLSRLMVKRYAEAMKAGKWKENTPEPISFTPEGVLVDGQHRLAAVVYSNVAVRMTINRNADADDFKVIDTGKRRSASDSLAVLGVRNCMRASSGILFYFQLRDGGIAGTNGLYQKYGTDDVIDEYFSCENIWARIATFSKTGNKRSRGILRVQIIGGVYGHLLKTKGHTAEDIERFFNEVATCESKCAAVKMLHSRLIDMKGRRGNDNIVYMLKSIAKAWNHFIAGNNGTKLRVLETEDIEFN